MDEEIVRALKKRAAGFYAKEVTEEFSGDGEGPPKLLKRKVNKKYIPPDVSAARELMSIESGDAELMSDETTTRNRSLTYYRKNFGRSRMSSGWRVRTITG